MYGLLTDSLTLMRESVISTKFQRDFSQVIQNLSQKIIASMLSCSVSRYASFHETAKADAVLGYLIAFLVLLATIKLWHLLRLNPKLHMITATLQRAWTDISGFLVVMTIMFLAYSIAVSSFPHTYSVKWNLFKRLVINAEMNFLLSSLT